MLTGLLGFELPDDYHDTSFFVMATIMVYHKNQFKKEQEFMDATRAIQQIFGRDPAMGIRTAVLAAAIGIVSSTASAVQIGHFPGVDKLIRESDAVVILLVAKRVTDDVKKNFKLRSRPLWE